MDKNEPRVESRMSAAKGGRVRFIGNPCKRCGGTVRYTSAGQCVECAYATAQAQHNLIRDTLRKAREN